MFILWIDWWSIYWDQIFCQIFILHTQYMRYDWRESPRVGRFYTGIHICVKSYYHTMPFICSWIGHTIISPILLKYYIIRGDITMNRFYIIRGFIPFVRKKYLYFFSTHWVESPQGTLTCYICVEQCNLPGLRVIEKGSVAGNEREQIQSCVIKFATIRIRCCDSVSCTHLPQDPVKDFILLWLSDGKRNGEVIIFWPSSVNQRLWWLILSVNWSGPPDAQTSS